MDNRSFVSDEFRASLVIFLEVTFHELLEKFIITQIDGVPELGFAMVQVVDTIEVQVLLVPTEHALPLPSINIGTVHAFDLLVF